MSDFTEATRRNVLAAAAAGAGLAAAGAAEAKSKAKTPAEPPMTMDPILAQVKLEHIFDVRIDFGERKLSDPLPWGGVQGYTPVGVRGGLVKGPRLNGRVVPMSGADFANVRADGVVEFSAHYLLETDDGAMIYIQNKGYGAGLRPNADGTPAPFPGSGYFRCAPIFKVEAGPHDWLTRTIIVGSGERHTDPDHSMFRYYAVL